jgi:3-dehydroquinate synthase
MNSLTSLCTPRGIIFADPAVLNHAASLQKIIPYEIIPVPQQKTRETKQQLEDELFKRKMGRDTTLIALGGGTTTDLIGFLASTYMRGVPVIYIPTTLLAMVDAAIGGKTGVDTPFGKNTIGTFYTPKAILIEPSFLQTLSPLEWKNGLAEILKYGLIDDETLFAAPQDYASIIPRCIAIKEKIVKLDPQEKGLRRILNFGHTIGHALETQDNIPHGLAVAVGCVAESYLSHILGYLSAADFARIRALYKQLDYPLRPLHSLSTLDKKAKNGEIRFVLIDRIGHALEFNGEYCSTVPKSALDDLIRWLR